MHLAYPSSVDSIALPWRRVDVAGKGEVFGVYGKTREAGPVIQVSKECAVAGSKAFEICSAVSFFDDP
ncbi:hypothetical protein FNU76_02125 [Chitinimonas arctica]|uniref:Uncharacterized protein n=1 Tax=Chitinimonas arctica TaxID=2594795 RepID=A0A516SAQ7_9NEIS|nr:hypothetical protein [Chitinimonas arctica]QDQ25244.1 hypothetical protein FNU76_02125 [Chitinimonas arctica]